MAINKKPQQVGLSDPKLVRQATTKLTQDAIAAKGKPAIIEGTAVLPRTTVQATATSVNVTTSANNQVADTTTVYRTSGAIYVSSIDQTVQQVTNKNIVNQIGVSQIIAGNNVTITSSGAAGTGIVTINTTAPALGNISAINLDGNAANVLHGDGSWSADTTTYGNSNVVTLLGAFGSNNLVTLGNVNAGKLLGNGAGLTDITGGNVTGAVGLATYASTANAVAGANVSGAVGLATYASTANAVAGANVSGFVANANVANSALSLSNGNSNLSIPVANSNVIITSNGTEQWIFADEGTLYAPGNVVLSGNVIAVGPGANTLAAGLLNPTLVISSNSAAYVQAAITNVSDIGSADWIAYGHHGNDAGGWADLGFTSAAFSDANYTITGPGDGYVFAQGFPVGQAPAVGGGSLILATGTEGDTKDIIFGTGGFGTSNIFGKISHANNALELSRAGSGITVAGGNISGANVVSANYFVGNGANLSAIAGANVSGFVANANVANTAFLLANGNSNVNIATANGNITLTATSNTTMTITDTGANITGTANISGNVIGGNISTAGQITSTQAGNLSDGGGQLYLNGTGNNRIDFNSAGTGAPTDTTRSAGTKITLFPALSASQVDYAIGVDSATVWTSVPVNSASFKFKWYGNTTEVANLDGTGVFQTAGSISTAGIVKSGVYTTSTIPAAATAGAGARAFVTDADSTTFKAAYVGGSGNAVPVFSDGSAWYVG